MSEATQTRPETTIAKIQDGLMRTQPGAPTRIYRIAAGVGIAVGCVFITAAIFVFGFVIGGQRGMYVTDAGYDSGYEADREMNAGDPDDDGEWGGWTRPDDGGAERGRPVQPAPAPRP